MILCNACCSLVTDREFVMLQLEKKSCPENEPLSQGSMENLGVKEMLQLLRRYNADRNRGELNCRFIEWILEKEFFSVKRLATSIKLGTRK